MAMAAAHFETGADASERVALEWLESAPPPAMRASDAYERSIVRTYVPVNDVHGGVVSRPRQDRAFPRVRPHEDSVFLIWNAEPEPSVRAALDQVCRKVTRVGHSSSAVQMWVFPEGQEPEPNLIPGGSKQRLRVAGPGTLQSLTDSFNGEAIDEFDRLEQTLAAAKGREKTRLKNDIANKFGGVRPESRRPRLDLWQGYGQPQPDIASEVIEGPFDASFLVLRQEDGPALGLEPTLRLTAALRNAAMKAAGERVPEWLSGHDETGAPSRRNHIAFFPLPFVGSEFADGHVMGLGIAIPKDVALAGSADHEDELKRVLGRLFFDEVTGEERDIELWSNPETWRWTLGREMRERPAVSLRRETWTMPSRTWASVTPVVLHHHPKRSREGDTERIVCEAFVSAGFPEPEIVQVVSVSAFEGAGHAMSMPPFTEGGAGMCRYQTHVRVAFAQRVQGPMLVGRGRFRGYGLFRPLREQT
jgi:CRISPR-associated protein Csb2